MIFAACFHPRCHEFSFHSHFPVILFQHPLPRPAVNR
jgi:hypothetical protein